MTCPGKVAQRKGHRAEHRVLNSVKRVISKRGSKSQARLARREEDRAGIDVVVRSSSSPRWVLIQVKASKCPRHRPREYYAAKGIAVVITKHKIDAQLDCEIESLIAGAL